MGQLDTISYLHTFDIFLMIWGNVVNEYRQGLN
jgi:hypothetical protein